VNDYSYTDATLRSGSNYYRLKIVAADGHFIYSPVRVINDSTGGLMITVYPNPIQRDGLLYISSSANCESIRLADASGRIILSTIAHGLYNTLSPGLLTKGIYFVQVDTDAGRKVVKVFVK
jgi:hypothetical protein